MRELYAYLSSLLLIIIASIALLTLSACAKKNEDNLKPYRNMTAAELFNQGEIELKKHKYSKATKTLEALEVLYPFGEYAEQGQLDLIYANYKNNDPAATLAATDRFIRLYPRSPHADYAYYMKGFVSDQQGLTWLQRGFGIDPAEHDLDNKKQAYLAYNEIIQRFPDSIYAPNAAVRMDKIRNVLAHKQVMLAQFYLKRKAYIAAANRASVVVEHYDGSPEVIPALAIMVKAYRAAGLKKMADDTLKILQASYPKAPELQALIH